MSNEGIVNKAPLPGVLEDCTERYLGYSLPISRVPLLPRYLPRYLVAQELLQIRSPLCQYEHLQIRQVARLARFQLPQLPIVVAHI